MAPPGPPLEPLLTVEVALFTIECSMSCIEQPPKDVGLGGLCSKIPILCYAPMPVKTTIMLQPQVYCAHNMLMNNIN